MADQILAPEEDYQLERFCRQYVQFLPILDYPDGENLRNHVFQEALYGKLFDDGALKYPPPQGYQLRVLKELTKRIEESIQNWEEDGVSDNLMNQLGLLISTPLPTDAAAAQQPSYVTYTFSSTPLLSSISSPNPSQPPTITLLESASLLARSGTTGLRTWEAALHLSTYLTQHPALTHSKTILELGCGTGLVSILCAKYLRAKHVFATDGSPETLVGMNTSLYLNGLATEIPEVVDQEAGTQRAGANQNISLLELTWGHLLPSGEHSSFSEYVASRSGSAKLDLVLAADVIWSPVVIPSLIATFDDLFALYPDVEVLVSSTIRNRETYEVFVRMCEMKEWGLKVEEWELRDRKRQEGPWYGSLGEGIEILLIRKEKVVDGS